MTNTFHITASCTCLYDWGGYCKHVVATLLTVIYDSSSVPIDTKPLGSRVAAGLDADALRALVHHLIEADPVLVDIVDEFCNSDE